MLKALRLLSISLLLFTTVSLSHAQDSGTPPPPPPPCPNGETNEMGGPTSAPIDNGTLVLLGLAGLYSYFLLIKKKQREEKI